MELIALYHKLAGHQGHTKTQELLKQAGIQADTPTVKAFCDSCPVCARGKSHKGHLAIAALQQVPAALTAKPLDSLHLDFVDLGSCPSDPSVEALLTIVDAHSRFTWLLPCTGKHETTASTIARLDDLFKDHTLSRLVTDNGPQFRHDWDTHWAARGVATHHTAVGNPKGNGLVERANRTATSIIRLLLLDGGHHRWTQVVPAAQRAINWTKNSSTGYTPHELFYGVTPNINPQAVRHLLLAETRHGANSNSAHRHAQNVNNESPRQIRIMQTLGTQSSLKPGARPSTINPSCKLITRDPTPL